MMAGNYDIVCDEVPQECQARWLREEEGIPEAPRVASGDYEEGNTEQSGLLLMPGTFRGTAIPL